MSSKDGHKYYVNKTLSINLKIQTPTSSELQERVKSKLNLVSNKGYIQMEGLVNSYTFFSSKNFEVVKGSKGDRLNSDGL